MRNDMGWKIVMLVNWGPNPGANPGNLVRDQLPFLWRASIADLGAGGHTHTHTHKGNGLQK